MNRRVGIGAMLGGALFLVLVYLGATIGSSSLKGDVTGMTASQAATSTTSALNAQAVVSASATLNAISDPSDVSKPKPEKCGPDKDPSRPGLQCGETEGVSSVLCDPGERCFPGAGQNPGSCYCKKLGLPKPF